MHRFSKTLILVTIIGLWTSTAFSLDPRRSLKQYLHEKWTSDNGLPQNSVSSILQSRDGYMWFATQEGIVRFDGLHMKVFDRTNTPELVSNNVGVIAEDKNGGIWIFPSGRGGITRLKNGKFKTFTTNDGLASSGRNGGAIDSSGNLWISSNKGISRIVGDTITVFTRKDGLPSDTAGTMYCDPEGGLWMATFFKMTHYKDGKFTTYSREDGLLTDTVTAF